MACQGCINRQRRWAEYLCKKKPDSKLCLKAKARLERMLAPTKEKPR
jgi:hypothetical protein